MERFPKDNGFGEIHRGTGETEPRRKSRISGSGYPTWHLIVSENQKRVREGRKANREDPGLASDRENLVRKGIAFGRPVIVPFSRVTDP